VKALFDTNILIDCLHGVEAAQAELDRYGYNNKYISIITWMEVLVGARTSEEADLKNWLLTFNVVALDEAIAQRAVHIRQKERIRLPDAIIWATAQVNALLLVSRNVKDFPADHPFVRVPYTL